MKKTLIVCVVLVAIVACLAVTASAAPNLAQPVLSKLNSAFLDLSSKLVLNLNLNERSLLDLNLNAAHFLTFKPF